MIGNGWALRLRSRPPTGGATRRTSSCSASTAPRGRPRTSCARTRRASRRPPKRDHRRLGEELDLFSFPEEIGSGLAVFHPKGGIIRREMEDYSRARSTRPPGYELVVHAAHHQGRPLRDLRAPRLVRRRHVPADADRRGARRRGHIRRQGVDYYLKPMNCPFHILIYQARGAVLPRPAAAPVRVRDRLPLRAVGRRPRPHPRAGLHPGRRAHLLHPGAAGGRAAVACSTSSSTCSGLRPRRLLPRAVDRRPREVRRRDRRVGGGDRGAAPGRRGVRPRAGHRPGRGRVLRPEDLRPDPDAHRARPGRCPPSRSTSNLPRALRARVPGRRRHPRSGRS